MFTNKDMIGFVEKAGDLDGLKGVKFCYAVAKNKNKFVAEIEVLNESNKLGKTFTKTQEEFESKRLELNTKYCKKDAENNPVMTNRNYVIENRAAFDKEYKKLTEEYKDLLAEIKRLEENSNELLKLECKVELFKIKFDEIPADITVKQMNIIEPLVEI
jgi:hypothetical protein